MTRKVIWSAASATVVSAAAVWTFAAFAGPSGRAVGPGIQAMASSSTAVIIADVLETNPRKAIEGARDTVKLKVVRTLLGRPAPGDTLGVYYHLLWSDEKMEVLEPPKFVQGRRYLIFLRNNELTDPWLAVLPDNVHLTKEVAAAVRVSHGDAQSEWSSTDSSIAGLQGRLVAYREETSNSGAPIIAVYLDVRNTSGGPQTVDFDLNSAKIDWVVSDATGKAIAPSSPPGNWLPTKAQKVTLAAKESDRLLLTASGAGVAKDGAGHLELISNRMWDFAKSDRGPYFLTGTIMIKPTGDRSLWYGTMALPSVRIPLGE
jgi:hypothetical protein